MTTAHFQTQMNRLAETFGKQHYMRERVELIWREVKDFEDRWLTGVVDEFIGTLRHGPLLPEFREKTSVERERAYAIEKEKNRVESERAFNRIFDGQIIGSICKTIGDRVRGNVDDGTFGHFVRGIRSLGKVRCERCEDTGLVWEWQDAYEYPFRCICMAGDQHGKKIPQLRLIQGGRAG